MSTAETCKRCGLEPCACGSQVIREKIGRLRNRIQQQKVAPNPREVLNIMEGILDLLADEL